MKNRPDSYQPCYAGDVSDDIRFLQEAIKKIDCVPIFWRDLDIQTSKKTLCELREQYKSLDSMISSYSGISTGRSCTSMDTLVFQSKKTKPNNKHITIKISHMEYTYQETENVQDFSFESFFSSLGGFIGIFLGYSMLQIPELLDDLSSHARRLKTSTFRGIIIYYAQCYILICLSFTCHFHQHIKTIMYSLFMIATLNKMTGKMPCHSDQDINLTSREVNLFLILLVFNSGKIEIKH